MITTKQINKVLEEDMLPVFLVRAKGYCYFVYDDGKAFETQIVGGVFRLNQLTKDEWIRLGRVFGIDTIHQKGLYP